MSDLRWDGEGTMNDERLEEIRAFLAEEAPDSTYRLGVARELLAEVDRLRAKEGCPMCYGKGYLRIDDVDRQCGRCS